MAGFFWGDCSLSNILFRRDGGALTGYLVDVETGEVHAKLSDGQRCYDVAIAEDNVAGEVMDLAAADSLPEDWDAIENRRRDPGSLPATLVAVDRRRGIRAGQRWLI